MVDIESVGTDNYYDYYDKQVQEKEQGHPQQPPNPATRDHNLEPGLPHESQ